MRIWAATALLILAGSCTSLEITEGKRTSSKGLFFPRTHPHLLVQKGKAGGWRIEIVHLPDPTKGFDIIPPKPKKKDGKRAGAMHFEMDQHGALRALSGVFAEGSSARFGPEPADAGALAGAIQMIKGPGLYRIEWATGEKLPRLVPVVKWKPKAPEEGPLESKAEVVVDKEGTPVRLVVQHGWKVTEQEERLEGALLMINGELVENLTPVEDVTPSARARRDVLELPSDTETLFFAFSPFDGERSGPPVVLSYQKDSFEPPKLQPVVVDVRSREGTFGPHPSFDARVTETVILDKGSRITLKVTIEEGYKKIDPERMEDPETNPAWSKLDGASKLCRELEGEKPKILCEAFASRNDALKTEFSIFCKGDTLKSPCLTVDLVQE